MVIVSKFRPSTEYIEITITGSSGAMVLSKTVATSEQYYADFDFKISNNFKSGTYHLTASDGIGNNEYRDSTNFTVGSQ